MTPTLPDDPLALFLDVDGTLIDIAPRPEMVQVSHELIEALARLEARLGGALALVSGRTIADLDALFAPLRLRASGVHGAELRLAPAEAVSVSPDGRLLPTVVVRVQAIADGHRDSFVENKGYSLAVHYRANPGAAPAIETALRQLVAETGLRLLPGHMVFEIKSGNFDKGSAIAALMRRHPFEGRRPVFLGDDITDLPGFEAVRALGGSAFSVSTPREGVSGHFDSPAAVRSWLAALANTLG